MNDPVVLIKNGFDMIMENKWIIALIAVGGLVAIVAKIYKLW